DISYVPPIPMTNNNDIEHPLTGKRYELPELGSGAQGNSLTENVLQILEENAEESCFLLDFEYLCFSPNYVEENQVEYAWHLARSLSAYISENGKEREVLRLLMDCDDLFSFEERFTALKNEWLESIGSTVQLSAKEHPIQYGNYGRFALFQMKTAHGDWYVQAGLDSSLTEDKQYAWLLRRNYKETNALMQCYERELAFVDKVLKDPTYNYPRATFTFQEKLSGNLVGEFTGDGNIFLSSAYAIVHEYCHYLLLQEDLFVKKGKSLQKYIGQLHLLPYYYGAYSKTFYLLWSYINDFYERQYTGSKEPIPCPEILEEWLYREMTAEEKEDIVNRANMRAIELMSDRQTENDYSLISFAIYIAQTYGEDTLYLVSTGGNQVEELTGHTWESLRKEWKEYLKKNYDVDSV
ncbi:MAG: hypothetical protein K2N94_02300, partial [Lachnospiraceae bacterium]|nr:hypothetical protein [Lachnospiraceae bacterium]